MILKAGHIYLRPLTVRDAPQMFSAVEISRKELAPWMYWEQGTKSSDDLLPFIRSTQSMRRKREVEGFGIFDVSSKIYLGGAGLHAISPLHNGAELGYWVRSDYHRQGIGFAASVALLRLGFEEMGLHKINVRANVKNEASNALIKKLGFVHEGTARDDYKVRGKWGDHYFYGLLENEYQAQKGAFDRMVPRDPDAKKPT